MSSIDKFIPASAGNATDFGDLTVARHSSSSMGNDTRAIFAGGADNYGGNSFSNVVDYITYSTEMTSTDFGDGADTTSKSKCSASTKIRGINCGVRIVSNGNVDSSIEYVTIASTGNMLDFGDLSITTGTTANKGRNRQGNGMSGSSTRGLASGGYTPSALSNVIQYVTIASTGDSTDFGDLSASTDELTHMSSNTRGVVAGGAGGGVSFRDTIEYVTIASTGNVTDFGDMTVAKAYSLGASSSTKGFILGGYTAGFSSSLTKIETITFSTTGNGTDFGDLTAISRGGSANASSHAAVQNETGFAPAAIGLFGGGIGDGSPRYNTVIQYINIASTGNTVIFGDLSVGRDYMASGGFASSTRGVFAGGYTGADSDVIDFVTFSTKGKATDFGNLVTARYSPTAFSNSTRGIAGGGRNDASASNLNVIEYVTIASAGNTTDFGDLSANKQGAGGTASATRGIFHGGNSPGDINVIEYVTIASTGNATDFGDSGAVGYGAAGASSSTRGVFGGRQSSGVTNVIEYITIASTGNATDFGDLTVTKELAPAVSSGTRAVFGSGSTSSNVMDYITIASTGNAQDFGDMEAYQQTAGSASNSHGGI